MRGRGGLALPVRAPRSRGRGLTSSTSGKVAFDFANVEITPDMTIRRPDGSWIFHFVNVVDDLEMRITHVIRGEDHLSNTPKHIQLFRALGAEPPRYGHIPLILNKDGSKMSKRDQGASITSYLEGGYAPEAVRNYFCLLGWSPKDDREILPLDEVIARFDPRRDQSQGRALRSREMRLVQRAIHPGDADGAVS